jgi:hypothetical protein
MQMRSHTLAAALVAVLLFVHSFAGASHGKIVKRGFTLTGTGAAQQVQPTPAATVYTRVLTIQNSAANSDPVYVSNANTVSASNALYSLSPGQAVTLRPSDYYDERGQVLEINDFWILATAAEVVFVSYEVRE